MSTYRHCLVYLTFVAFSLPGCGGSGKGDSQPKRRRNPPKANPSQNPSARNFDTNVGMGLVNEQLPVLPGCATDRTRTILTNLETPFVLDGDLTEWSTDQIIGFDREGDAPSGADVREMRMSLWQDQGEEYVVGMVSGDLTMKPNRNLYLEFGGPRGKIDSNMKLAGDRLYRLERNHVEEWNGIDWVKLAPGIANVKWGQGQAEWVINLRQLDRVFLKAMWWARAAVYQDQTDELDTSATIMMPSLDTINGKAFSIRRCQTINLDTAPVVFQEIHTKGVHPDHAELYFGVVRLVVEHLRRAMGAKAFPVVHLPVLVSRQPRVSISVEFDESDDAILRRGVFLRETKSTTENLERGLYRSVYLEVMENLLRGFLAMSDQTPYSLDAQLVIAAICHELLQGMLGTTTWLSHLNSQTDLFLRQEYVEQIVPLHERFERLAQGDVPDSEVEHYRLLTLSKLSAFTALLTESFGVDRYLPALLEKRPMKEALPLTEDERLIVSRLWPGWVELGAFGVELGPEVIADADSDGLPGFFEERIGTESEEIDSDEDGWSDFIEYALSGDPRNASVFPSKIVADGFFGDWTELLPGEISRVSSRRNSACPASAVLDSVIGIADQNSLIVAAIAREKWEDEFPVAWEIQIEFRVSRKVYLVRAVSGERTFRVYNEELEEIALGESAIPFGVYATEIQLIGALLGIDEDFSRKRGLRFKVGTIYENKNRVTCDRSDWVYPLVKAKYGRTL